MPVRKSVSALFGALVICLVGVSHTEAQAAAPELEWKVQHRFRALEPDPSVKFEVLAAEGSDLDRKLDEIAATVPATSREGLLDYVAPYRDDKRLPAYRKWNDLLKAAADKPESQNWYRHSYWTGAGTGAAAKTNKWQRGYRRDEVFRPDLGIAVRVKSAASGPFCVWSTPTGTLTASCDQWIGVPVGAASTELKVHVANGGTTSDGSWKLRSCQGAADCSPEAGVMKVRRQVVVSLGESYAAGEGSPDRPTNWGAKVGQDYFKGLNQSSPKYGQDARYRWWHRKGVTEDDFTPAEWWDPYCHRSLYSQHVAAAALYAARHPHEAVTFLSFSCAGAGVFNGILTPQAKPPGVLEFKAPKHGAGIHNESQIQQMLDVLCERPVAPRSEDRKALAGSFVKNGFESETAQLRPEHQLTCGSGNSLKHPPDAILLSIGGNDVGFGGSIMDGVIPRAARALPSLILLPIIRDQAKADPPDLVNDRILRELPSKYRFMKAIIREAVGPETIVVQSSYLAPIEHPNPSRVVGAPTLEFCGGYDANKAFVALRGILPDKNVSPRARWEFELTPEEERNVAEGLLDPLNKLVSEMASPAGEASNRWMVAKDFVEATRAHGWCATNGPSDFLELPYWSLDAKGVDKPAEGGWLPFSPGEWDAYQPRGRYFRTPNDAILTQMANRDYHIGPLPLGAVLAAGGSFHPTGEGYFIVGLNVAAELEEGLK